jgi:hypothetical protein
MYEKQEVCPIATSLSTNSIYANVKTITPSSSNVDSNCLSFRETVPKTVSGSLCKYGSGDSLMYKPPVLLQVCKVGSGSDSNYNAQISVTNSYAGAGQSCTIVPVCDNELVQAIPQSSTLSSVYTPVSFSTPSHMNPLTPSHMNPLTPSEVSPLMPSDVIPLIPSE